MPLPEHRVLEHNRNQDNGEPSAQPSVVELPPAIRADLLDPALWQDGLAKYARGTNLAVALADAAGRLIGEAINPRPTWSLLHAKPPPTSPASEGAARGVGCPFSLAPLKPCNCVADALARGGFVVARDRTGLVHFAVPLVLRGHPLGALVAGQVFDQYPEQLPLEQVAKQLGLSPARAWQLARLEHPVKRATLEVYDLLATLGQTFLRPLSRSGQKDRCCRGSQRGAAPALKRVLSAQEDNSADCATSWHRPIPHLIAPGCVRRQRCLRLRKRARWTYSAASPLLWMRSEDGGACSERSGRSGCGGLGTLQYTPMPQHRGRCGRPGPGLALCQQKWRSFVPHRQETLTCPEAQRRGGQPRGQRESSGIHTVEDDDVGSTTCPAPGTAQALVWAFRHPTGRPGRGRPCWRPARKTSPSDQDGGHDGIIPVC